MTTDERYELHLAREREMKGGIPHAAGFPCPLHLAREREMKDELTLMRITHGCCISPVSGK